MTKLLYNRPFCRIYYHADLQCIHLDWEGYAFSEQFREACDASLQALKEYHVSKMIADNTKAKVVGTKDQNWMQEDWFPRAFAVGFRMSAVVVAEDIFRDISVKNIVNRINNQQFEVQYFTTLEAAKGWVAPLGSPKDAQRV